MVSRISSIKGMFSMLAYFCNMECHKTSTVLHGFARFCTCNGQGVCSEVLLTTLGCKKPCKYSDKLPTSTGDRRNISINSTSASPSTLGTVTYPLPASAFVESMIVRTSNGGIWTDRFNGGYNLWCDSSQFIKWDPSWGIKQLVI